MRLAFDATGHLVIVHDDGFQARVTNPFVAEGPDRLIRVDSLLDGCFRLAGGRVESAGPRISIDFHAPQSGWVVHRWEIAADGGYLGQAVVELAAAPPPGGQHLVNQPFVAALQQRHNDQQIYDFLRLSFGRPAAAEFIEGLAADHAPEPAAPDAGCRLVVIFNHHYARNCRPIHALYRQRFPAIDFVLPGPAPRHPNYHAFPFGSYQFHGLVHGYLAERERRDGHRGCRAYLFIQDDVLLHPAVNAAKVLDLVGDAHGGVFHRQMPLEDDQTWLWTKRIQNSIQTPADMLVGNGFEGLSPAVPVRQLFFGVSDCFALASDVAGEFNALLAPLVAANVFPEAAIPTALFHAGSRQGKPIAIRPGTFVRHAEREKLKDPAFLDAFLASDSLFLHPVKLARAETDLARLLGPSACRPADASGMPAAPTTAANAGRRPPHDGRPSYGRLPGR
jgi:hypothetical protein